MPVAKMGRRLGEVESGKNDLVASAVDLDSLRDHRLDREFSQGTDRIAAWWKTTTRTPRVARSTTPRCLMSPRTTSSRRPNALAKGRLLRAPVYKLSSTRTRAPPVR